jgi:membrane protease YdiL (CAAX protease family)
LAEIRDSGPAQGAGFWRAPMALGERRVLHPGKLRWLRALGWMVALVFGVALAAGPTMEAIGHLLPRDNAPLQFLSHCAGAIIALAAYALLVFLGEARTPRELALRPALPEIAAGLMVGLLMFSAVMAVMLGFNLYDITWHGPTPAWHGAGLAIQSSVLEEVVIRGAVLRLAWRAFGPWAAFIISAALFGVGHAGNPGASLFSTLCVGVEAGIMLGSFYALTGRLWISIGVHAAWNFTQGYLFGAAVSGGDFGEALARSTARRGLPDWLTGGAFGPEASAPAFGVCLAVGAAALWAAWRSGRFARAVPA